MEINILDHYNAKLYDKESVANWDLPKKTQDVLGLNEYDYFFLTSAKEDDHGEQHVHLSVYPSKYDNVYLLEVQTAQIVPQLLHDVLTLLKGKNYDIITSTGFCTHKDLCHFGVFFSVDKEIENQALISEIKKIEKVTNAISYSFTCEGCVEN